jgi:hypothetical protein
MCSLLAVCDVDDDDDVGTKLQKTKQQPAIQPSNNCET